MTHPLHILADRVEGLSGPCRETDALIAIAVRWKPLGNVRHWANEWPAGLEPTEREGWVKLAGHDHNDHWQTRAYTASIDAAMTLVPEGHAFLLDWGSYAESDPKAIFWEAYVQRTDDAVARGNAEATTPALALTAASIRAIAANQESEA